ncbi:MAG TPA: 3-oxoacyl-[acyl-carrier-protein] reductase [Acidobacteriota bacterium]|nr:3-oxoacyl-[acyl-carrier-protein] reductase [Acidobacteriota bacterium]
MSDLGGRIALVTGASRGIGRRIAQDLAADGAMVLAASRKQADVDALAEEIASQGGRAAGVALDVSDREQVKSALSTVLKEHGAVDILVNNAGITRDGLMLRMKDADWDAVLATNLTGAFAVTREVLAAMLRKRAGRIVNITSVVGQMGNPGQANYVSSKAGVIGFTKALAREVASRGITVNAVAPGFIATDMTAEVNEKAAQELKKQIPLGRIGTVEDVSSGVRFLVSDAAGYITGHVLNINGGLYM